MTLPILSLVVARAANGVIGVNGALPWRLSDDLKRFKAITLGKPVIMGRKTWDSLPKRPLPGRTNIVLSRDGSFEPQQAVVCETFLEAMEIAREQASEDGMEEVCVIGGEAVFALAMPKARRLYLTEVETTPQGDAFFPPLDETAWREVSREAHVADGANDHAFVFRVLERA